MQHPRNTTPQGIQKHSEYALVLIGQRHRGVTVKGRVVNSPIGHGVIVILDHPIRSQQSILLNLPSYFAEPTLGMDVFGRDGSLTESAIDAARRGILWLYDEELLRREHTGEHGGQG